MDQEGTVPKGAAIEIQWRCPECLEPNRFSGAPGSLGPLRCGKCKAERTVAPEAWNEEHELKTCPACGCPDLYRQRDFNRKLGLAIIGIGAVLAPFTKFISLIVCGLIDFAIYYFISDVVICYHCRAIMRGVPGTEKVPPFDLNTSDKYLETERKRGW